MLFPEFFKAILNIFYFESDFNLLFNCRFKPLITQVMLSRFSQLMALSGQHIR